jgi:pimeloyl-ACP methyl ester carboxylesterase
MIGRDDVIAAPNAAMVLVEKIPLVSIVQIQDAGHGWMHQYPEKFSRIVQTFLDTN